MTLEDDAFQRIVAAIRRSGSLTIISAHPPSGKSYDTDLIRIPNPASTGAAGRRWHLDLIFANAETLFLAELKGKSSESADDVSKLGDILRAYSLPQLLQIIKARSNLDSRVFESLASVQPAIGCVLHDGPEHEGILYIEAPQHGVVNLSGATSRLSTLSHNA